MATLANQIENYIKEQLAASKAGSFDIKRSALAEIFMCAPSQINYVLETRFSTSQGYCVESKRGGGGYIRITRLLVNPNNDLHYLVEEAEGKHVSQQIGEGLIDRLVEEEFLTKREGMLLKGLLSHETLRPTLHIQLPQGYELLIDYDLLRGRLLKSMLVTLLREDFE